MVAGTTRQRRGGRDGGSPLCTRPPFPCGGYFPVPLGHGFLSSVHFTHGGHISSRALPPVVNFCFDCSSFWSRIPEGEEKGVVWAKGKEGRGEASAGDSSFPASAAATVLGIFFPCSSSGRPENILVSYCFSFRHAREHPSALVDDFQRRPNLSIMSHHYGQDQEEINVVGFEVPRSPDTSYTNLIPGNEDEARDPPLAPPHLQHTLLSYPSNRSNSSSLPSPQNVILNHLYIENRETPRSVVALGITHRFRSKYVTVVLYKPTQRRGN